jgi:hypothetical protein
MGHRGGSNDENDYDVGRKDEWSAIVAWCRMCAANNCSRCGSGSLYAIAYAGSVQIVGCEGCDWLSAEWLRSG